MNQHEATTTLAEALNALGLQEVRTVRPLGYIGEGLVPTVILCRLADADLSVTVEILAQP